MKTCEPVLPLLWFFPELDELGSMGEPLGLVESVIKRLGAVPGEAVKIISTDMAVKKPLDDILPESPLGGPWILPVPTVGARAFLDKALSCIERRPSFFRDLPLIPLYLKPSLLESGVAPSWQGLLPFGDYSGEIVEMCRSLVRVLYPSRYFNFLLMENYALAGVDQAEEALMERFFRSNAFECGPCRGKPWIIAICGIDGSGKSSHVAALKEFLQEMGLSVKLHKMYRHGLFHDTVTDLTRLCRDGKNLHLWRIQRIAKAFDSVKYFVSSVSPDLEKYDVLLFDRYVQTHFAAGTGRFHHDPFTRELLSCYPEADKLFLMDVPVDIALERIGEREERTVDENPYMLSRFRKGLLDLALARGDTILDGRKSFSENQEKIRSEVSLLLGGES